LGEERVCLGEVVGVHGVKGLVRVRPFTEEPEAFAAYGALQDERGRRLTLEAVGRAKGVVLARIEGVADRTQAEALKGTRLYIARAALPAIEEAETYYHADLIGLMAENADGQALGRVTAVHDFGAGDLLEIASEPAAGRQGRTGRGGRGDSLLVPFTREAVPELDLEAGRVVVLLPEAADGVEPAEEGKADGVGHER
jgi:16S rRNA processing protein RimM